MICSAFMSMLQKERWIFDPKRGLPRDTRDVQQSDRDLRDYLVGKNKVVEIDTEPVAPATTKQSRRKKNKPPALPPTDIDDIDEVPAVVEDKPPREKRKRNVQKKPAATKEAVLNDVFNNTFEIDSDTDTGSKKRMQPPRPPGRKTQEPQVPLVTPDDINSMLDAKLANMFDMITKNQSQLEKSFSRALEDQRKEFESTLAKQRASSVGNTDGLNSFNRVNFSPVSIPGNVFLFHI